MELLAIAYIRFRVHAGPLAKTIVQVIIGGLIVLGIGVALGKLGAAS